ncbi:GGDEF domain-containing protein [Candidatus Kaiserbacteria bacterium]|nr:GGDEF domain-containing protein [Candidatus Kaiserbacteria bacterium]USN88407.1 MAG: GGDEF domain-containing protein [Candidatus Nomurabacteria bacterium]
MNLPIEVWQSAAIGLGVVSVILAGAYLMCRRECVLLRAENEVLLQLANTDQLTGLGNRRLFSARAEYLMKLLPTPSTNQARYRERQAHIPALTAIYIDIDHFKQINDTYGHPAGDVVLRTLAVQLRKLLRDSDLICRFGGEEFVVLLPDDATDALRVAEKIRTAIANVDFGIKDLLGITISIGLCSVACQVPLDQLLSRADAALYAAKQSGRNRVVVFPFSD